MQLASEPDAAGHWASTAAGLAELSISGLGLFLTSKSWAKWVMPVAVIIGLKGLVAFAMGQQTSSPFRPVSREVSGEAVLYVAAVAILSFKFSSRTPKLPERLGLAMVVFATCALMLYDSNPRGMLIGVGFLAFTRAISSMRSTAGHAIKSRDTVI